MAKFPIVGVGFSSNPYEKKGTLIQGATFWAPSQEDAQKISVKDILKAAEIAASVRKTDCASISVNIRVREE